MNELDLRMANLAEEIKAKNIARKEEEKCRKITDVELIGKDGDYRGITKMGKEVIFERIEYGITKQGLYGAGTLKVKENGEWKTVFTKGYPSKALQWMMKN